jgi:hypothetical protein
VSVAGSAEQTPSVHDVALCRDAISLLDVGDQTTHLHHVAREFVSDYEWRLAASLRPGVPVVDVNVGAAYPRATHPYQNFILADPRLRDVF